MEIFSVLKNRVIPQTLPLTIVKFGSLHPPGNDYNMKTIHMKKQPYDGYCVGSGIDLGIVVWEENKVRHTV